jgi:hypothetical protein
VLCPYSCQRLRPVSVDRNSLFHSSYLFRYCSGISSLMPLVGSADKWPWLRASTLDCIAAAVVEINGNRTKPIQPASVSTRPRQEWWWLLVVRSRCALVQVSDATYFIVPISLCLYNRSDKCTALLRGHCSFDST